MKSSRLRNLTRRQIQIAAIALAAAIAAAGIYYYLRPRTLSVCVVSDYSFRQRHPDWQQLLDARFRQANRIFSWTGVHFDFRDADQPDPTGNMRGLETRRQKLVRVECDADLVLDVSGQPETAAIGDVPSFAHLAIVVDSPGQPEAVNSLVFAQALAVLFGAPSDPKGAGTLMTWPPESDRLSKPASRLASKLRWYDFAAGTAALEGPWRDRVYNALLSANSGRPGNAAVEAHRTMGLALAADENHRAAIAHLAEAVKLDPSSVQSHIDLATVYTHNYQPADAVPEYRAAVDLAPASAANHAGLAVALANSGYGEQAIDEFQAALRLDPKFATAQAGVAYVLTQQLGRIDAAIAAYRAALALDPTLPAAIDGLERAQAFKDRAAALLPERRKKAQEAPSSANAHFDLALAEARLGNIDAGIREFRRTLELDRSNGRAHANLATLLAVQNNYAEALKEAQAASQSGFDPPPGLVQMLKKKQ